MLWLPAQGAELLAPLFSLPEVVLLMFPALPMYYATQLVLRCFRQPDTLINRLCLRET